jgi:copper chaperone CopZ
MRSLCLAVVLVVAVGAAPASAQEGQKAEFKGLHICCRNCVKSVKGILDKVEGVTEVSCDIPTKTVTFMAKDMETAVKAMDALYAGGFAGTLTVGTTKTVRDTAVKSAKTKKVTVHGVHACCPQCHKAITKLFQGSRVTIAGIGPQRDVIVEGVDLDPGAILRELQTAGFSGKIQKKKRPQ